jgi:DNA-binding FadR family transcriptional regulator
MKFNEFTIGVSHTINLGNYESLKIEASVTIQPEKGEKEVVSRAQAQLRRLVEDTLKAQDHSELRLLLAELYAAKAAQRRQAKDMENVERSAETTEPLAGDGTGPRGATY